MQFFWGYISMYAFMHLADAFIQRLTVHSGYTFFVSMGVPWDSNPQPLHC